MLLFRWSSLCQPIVDIGVRAIGYGIDVHTANELNEHIRKKRLEQRKKENEG